MKSNKTMVYIILPITMILLLSTITPTNAGIGEKDWTFKNNPIETIYDENSGSLSYAEVKVSNGYYDADAQNYYGDVQLPPYNPHSALVPTIDVQKLTSEKDICATSYGRYTNYPDPKYDLDDNESNGDGCLDESEVVAEGYDQYIYISYFNTYIYYPIMTGKAYYFTTHFFENDAAQGWHSAKLYFSNQVSLWGPDPYHPTAPWEYQTVQSYQFDDKTYTYPITGGGPIQPQSTNQDLSASDVVIHNSQPLPDVASLINDYQISENFETFVELSAKSGEINFIDIGKTPDLIRSELQNNFEMTLSLVENTDQSVYSLITFESPISVEELIELQSNYNLEITTMEGLGFDQNNDYLTYNTDFTTNESELINEMNMVNHTGIYAINTFIPSDKLEILTEVGLISQIDTRAFNVHMYMEEFYGIEELSVHEYEVNDVFWKLGHIDNFIDRKTTESNSNDRINISSENDETRIEWFKIVKISIVISIVLFGLRKKSLID